MTKALSVLSGAGLGAGMMYLLDLDQGKRRRAVVRDQAGRSVRKTRDAVKATARDAQNRARGMVSNAKSWVSPAAPSTDEVLMERVRAKLGMLVRHPRSIEVAAHVGTVILSGPVLADEVDSLVAMVSRVHGVRHVENRLEIHEEAGDVPGLQGGPARRPRGDVSELMQSNWSPATRFLTGAAGSVVAMYGARQRTAVGAGLTALGLGFLLRGLLNRRFSDLLGIEESGVMRASRRRDSGPSSGETPRPGANAESRKRVRDVMTPGVEVIHPRSTVAEAAEKMKDLDVGILPVCDGDRLMGMLTDRDIVVRIIADQRDPKQTTVIDAMTPQVAYCFEDEDVQEAAMLMVDKQIRRLPVLNRDKRLVGIVSLGDLAVQTKNTQLSGEVLEYVSEPAEPRR
jgi:CBS domain-containing protein